MNTELVERLNFLVSQEEWKSKQKNSYKRIQFVTVPVTLTPLMETAQKLLVYQTMNVIWSILDFKY